MPDQSEVTLCIMGKTKDVCEAKNALSDKIGCFNPFRVYAMEEVFYQNSSYVQPDKGESISDYKKRMEKEYLDLQRRHYPSDAFRFHYGPVLNPLDFPGQKYVDKEICYFTCTGMPPIQQFITISNFLNNVAFTIKFDSSWLTHSGEVYISRGDVWFGNCEMHYKDRYGYDIVLDKNFDFRYITKHMKPGMLVSPEKLQGIDRTFKREEPKNMKYILTLFPHYYKESEPNEEEIHDDYVPVIYEPTEKEIRKYWDETLAEIISIDRHQFFNPKTIITHDYFGI